MNGLGVGIATAGGLGYAPLAPGTFGSAAGVLIFWLTADWPLAAQLALIAVVTLAGIWASEVGIRHFGRTDPSQVVIDEVAGQLVTFIGVAAIGWQAALLGFLLFRGFDIIKPWPVNRLEALHGGLGIMADDLMAGLYACAVLQGVLWMAPGFLG